VSRRYDRTILVARPSVRNHAAAITVDPGTGSVNDSPFGQGPRIVLRSKAEPGNTLSAIADCIASAGTNGLDLNLEMPRRIFDHEAGLMEVKLSVIDNTDLINGETERRGCHGFLTAPRLAEGPAQRDQPSW
jgi:hypothetical protein